MKQNKHLCRAAALLVSALLLFSLAACDDGRTGSSNNQLSTEEATETLDALLTKVNVMDLPAEMDLAEENYGGLAAELPAIESYEPTASGSGQIDVEIMSSTEKSVKSDKDGWLVDVAEAFNSEGFDLDGTSVSVTIRPVASGTATDYIVSGKHVPPGFSPSNELWPMMIESKGIGLELVEKSIAGNTAGILMSERKYKEFTEAHGDVTLGKIVDAVLAGELLLGYTNPYVSSTGLNILTSMLQSFDSTNPLSEAAVSKLEQLQAKVPPVALTTAQMRVSAAKGLLDAMVMEYQAYINTPELKDYHFTPFGVRHDNPVYATESCTPEQKEVLRMFADYCLEPEAQKMADECGFNGNADFTPGTLAFTGAELYQAQDVWKEKKDAGQPVVAVFVTDISGSMDGTPITELKTSLLNASQYIGENSHIGLISYNTDVFVNLPVAQFNNNQRASFNGAVKSLSSGGGTATYDAVLVAEQMLLAAKEEIPNAKLMMFVLSDGEQTDGYNFSKVAPVVEGLKIPVHTICYGTSIDEMRTMSELNEASNMQASPEDVVYNLKNIFNAQM